MLCPYIPDGSEISDMACCRRTVLCFRQQVYAEPRADSKSFS